MCSFTSPCFYRVISRIKNNNRTGNKNGFYYDFYTDNKVSNKDLKNIENKMSYISNLQLDIIRIKSSKK